MALMRKVKFDPAKHREGRDYVLADGSPLPNAPISPASSTLEQWLNVISKVKGRSVLPL